MIDRITMTRTHIIYGQGWLYKRRLLHIHVPMEETIENLVALLLLVSYRIINEIRASSGTALLTREISCKWCACDRGSIPQME